MAKFGLHVGNMEFNTKSEEFNKHVKFTYAFGYTPWVIKIY